MSDWGLHILIIADAVVRGRSLLRILSKKAVFMNSWLCLLISSAAFASMNASLSASTVDTEHEALVTGK
jgi:hypothetical protein